MSHNEALELLNEWKITGARLVASGKHADGSGISFPATTIKATSTQVLTLITGNMEMRFSLAAATFSKTNGIPAHLQQTLITSVSIAFPDGAALALCELAR